MKTLVGFVKTGKCSVKQQQQKNISLADEVVVCGCCLVLELRGASRIGNTRDESRARCLSFFFRRYLLAVCSFLTSFFLCIGRGYRL